MALLSKLEAFSYAACLSYDEQGCVQTRTISRILYNRSDPGREGLRQAWHSHVVPSVWVREGLHEFGRDGYILLLEARIYRMRWSMYRVIRLVLNLRAPMADECLERMDCKLVEEFKRLG